MARLCRTRGDGTTTFNAYVGIRHKLRGTELRARVLDMDLHNFQMLQAPVLFCDQTPHAVVMGHTNGRVMLNNPLAHSGRLVPLEEVTNLIHGAGITIRSSGRQPFSPR